MKLLPFLFLLSIRLFAQTDSLHFVPQTNVLYRDCMNILRLQHENINFSLLRVVCDSCEWKKNSLHPEKTGLVPHLKAKHAKITLYEGEKWIGEKVFLVIQTPDYKENLTISGQIPSLKPIGKGSKMIYTLTPDILFAKQCPLDAHYCIDKIAFFVQHELKAPIFLTAIDCSKEATEKGIAIYIPEKAFEPTGGKLFIEVKNIYRRDYLGDLKKEYRDVGFFGCGVCIMLK